MTQPELSKSERKEAAQLLWRKGFAPKEIRDYLQLDCSLRAVQQWQDEWSKSDEYCPEQVIWAADAELKRLISIPKLGALETKKMDILARLIETADTNRKNLQSKLQPRINKAKVYNEKSDNGSDDEIEVIQKPRKDSRGKPLHKNSIDHITNEMFEAFEKTLFYHQLVSLDAAFDDSVNSMRLILKCRQAGQTFVEAYIAFKRAVLTGQAHSFLSATIPQSMVFNGYIKRIASDHFSCEVLEGTKKIVLKKDNKNWGTFEFISSKVMSSQGRASHVVCDECAWWVGFERVDSVANAMATQNGYTLTYLSTPSTTQHDFYEYWTGERFNKYQAPHEKVDIDTRVSTFIKFNTGRLDGDGFYRYAYTIDSVLDNNPEFPYTIEKLKQRCPNPRTFDCIYRCVFTDDTGSEFQIKSLLRCLVTDAEWQEYSKSKRVGCGYDPSSGSETSGDEAAIGYIELPDNNEQPFRLLECNTFDDGSAKSHVDHFKLRKQSYNVRNFFTDVSGSGIYVWQHVKNEVPNATRVDFTVPNKTGMVLKMQDLVREKRFLFHEDNKHEVIASFMSIKKSFTPSTKQITYISTRSKGSGNGQKHGELFWTAAMVCWGTEGLNYEQDNQDILFVRA